MFGSINGTVEKIVFRCVRRIIEPSLDKFPYAAKVYHENDLTAPIYDARKQESFDFDQLAADEENVVIETHVANIQGALIWLLSAGSQVKILEPTALVDQIKTELQNALNNYKYPENLKIVVQLKNDAGSILDPASFTILNDFSERDNKPSAAFRQSAKRLV